MGPESVLSPTGGDLYLQDINGSNHRVLATDLRHRASPAWSPDGSRVVVSGLSVVTVSGETAQLTTDLLAEAASFPP